ncbi:carbon-nitrogen hydrolase family protein [Burkholderia multivorans]|uniref:carbon-nitrogen hydrolase family protein n=1 Tax=Burkholderia multivorans TaxID=87883 RepID=UPI0019D0CA76|nr:carbon-nitrogen hydrolase family protein [Burkholderia multivorans]MBN7129771.1 carbon-nitrogen hydrolase family protein [Burkholderia multivorans]QSL25738.1 carbon-nitrogen hydrolase family protein [Burkholderia multivorans]
MKRFSVAGVQMSVSAFEENLGQMNRYMAHIKYRFPWVNMVLFSELAALGPNPAKAEALPGKTEDRLREMAAKHGLWLIPGSLFERDGEHIYNTSPVIDPSGNVVARFRKLFPFRPYEQDTSAGSQFVIFDVPDVGRFGVSICYDMWFPETTRTLAAMGAEVILHPTMTDTIDRDVELAIARASAAINQVYFFDINGVGDGGVGRSIVVDPSGYVLHQAASGAEIIPIEIDFEKVRHERQNGTRHNLGQPLKSFRDREVDFSIYQREKGVDSYLQTLGPIVKPGIPIEDQ